jgi:hypothetical protein
MFSGWPELELTLFALLTYNPAPGMEIPSLTADG